MTFTQIEKLLDMEYLEFLPNLKNAGKEREPELK